MQKPLKKFLDRQAFRANEDAAFLSRLDPARTTFLSEILGEVFDPECLGRIGIPWLDLDRFTARIAAACTWLDGVSQVNGMKGWDEMWLFFFQAGSAQEDEAAHRLQLQRDLEEPLSICWYTKLWKHRPLGLRYFHTYANWSRTLAGSCADGSLRIPALFSGFSAPEPTSVLDDTRTYHPLKGKTLGYRLTDYPALLSVSPAIATDFLARMVVHDLCHGYLPHTSRAVEGFHNVVALTAMGSLATPDYRNVWERFIHAECTNPAFCLRAHDDISAVRRALGVPSPVQEDVLQRYFKWYASSTAVRNRAEIWGLPPSAGPADLLAKIEEARTDGFRIYLRYAGTR